MNVSKYRASSLKEARISMSFFSSKNATSGTNENKETPSKAQSALPDGDTSTPTSGSTTTLSNSNTPSDEQPDLSPEQARKHAAVSKQLAAAFGELVTLLMRSENDRKRPIAELEWMITPAIAAGQFAIADAQSKKTGATAPVAAVLWAMVSEEVDKRLSLPEDNTVRLDPKDWRSGPIPWIVLALGDKRIVAGLIKKLNTDVFKDQAPKIRSRNSDGKVVIGRVQVSEGTTSDNG